MNSDKSKQIFEILGIDDPNTRRPAKLNLLKKKAYDSLHSLKIEILYSILEAEKIRFLFLDKSKIKETASVVIRIVGHQIKYSIMYRIR